MRHRLAILAGSTDELADMLAGFARGEADPAVTWGLAQIDPAPRIALVVPGHGAPPGLGRDLYDAEPAFRTAIEECNEVLAPLLGTRSADELNQGQSVEYSVALGAAVRFAAAQLWRTWGVEFTPVLGLGAGATTARCIVGSLELPHLLDSVPHQPFKPEPSGCEVACDAIVVLGTPEQLTEIRADLSAPRGCVWLASLDGAGSHESMLRALAELYVRGLEVDWQGVLGDRGVRIHLPVYSFLGQRFVPPPFSLRHSSLPVGDDRPPSPRLNLGAVTTGPAHGVGTASGSGSTETVATMPEVDVILRIREAGESEQRKIIAAHISRVLRGVVELPPEGLDPSMGFADLGIDSLGSMDVIIELEESLKVTFPTATLSEYANLDELVTFVMEQVQPVR
jgi:acyl transferase domain-containing protein